MAKQLLEKLSEKFHKGVKVKLAENLNIKPNRLQHYVNGRPIKDWLIAEIREKYGKSTKRPNGLTDSEILDLLVD